MNYKVQKWNWNQYIQTDQLISYTYNEFFKVIYFVYSKRYNCTIWIRNIESKTINRSAITCGKYLTKIKWLHGSIVSKESEASGLIHSPSQQNN